MAINIDTEFEKSNLGESGRAPANESQETEKLLSPVTTEPAGGNSMKMSSSFTVNVGSDKNLDVDQNGHSLPFRSGSAGHLAAAPLSPSRVSLSRSCTSSIGNAAVQEAQKPKDYLILVILSCFCPVWPVSIVALLFSIMSRNSLQSGDMDGAKRLGKLARLLSVVSIFLGVLIIVVSVTVSVTKWPVYILWNKSTAASQAENAAWEKKWSIPSIPEMKKIYHHLLHTVIKIKAKHEEV